VSESGQWRRFGRVDSPFRRARCDNGVSPAARLGMHELGIATSILESVESAARRNPGVHITKVGVKVGELAGVDVDALQFGFECMVKDTEWEPLQLEVESIPRVQRCPKCGHEFRMTDYDPQCPQCGEFATLCISGEELDIAYMEVDE
jgi:hydrogenase nickel incorporation protein HypA/HybF